VTSSAAFELLIVVVCLAFIIYVACRRGAPVSPAKLPLCHIKQHLFPWPCFERATISRQMCEERSPDIYPSATDAQWMEALESLSEVLMQQRGTGFHTYFCPQYLLPGSWEQPIT